MKHATLIAFCIGFLTTTAAAAEPPITSVAFAPGGKSVVACSQAGLRIFSWPELKLQKTLKTAAVNAHDLAFSPKGDRLAVGGGTPAEEGTVEIFSWPKGKSLHVLKKHTDSVMAVAWRDESAIASSSLDHSIVLWDANSGKPIRVPNGHSRGVSTLCFLAQGETLVSAGIDQSLRVWVLKSGELIRSLAMHTMQVNDVALRPGKTGLPMIASASNDRTVRLWQPTIGRMVRFVRLKSKPLDVVWLTDGSQIVAACTDGHIRLIDPVEVTVTQDITAVKGWAYSLAVHPTDGSVVVGGQDGQLKRVVPSRAKR